MTVPIDRFDFKNEGPGLLICGLTDRPPNTAAASRPCCDCGRDVWVSYPMVRYVDAGEVLPACPPCADKRILAAPDPVAGMHTDQVESFKQAGEFDAARAYLADLNRRIRTRRN